MQNYQVTIELEAELSIGEIYQHYQEVAGQEIAERNLEILELAINSLNKLPTRCPISDFSPHIRKMVVPKLPYLIFYTIKDDEVIVMEVFNAKKDQRILSLKYQEH